MCQTKERSGAKVTKVAAVPGSHPGAERRKGGAGGGASAGLWRMGTGVGQGNVCFGWEADITFAF